MLVYERMTHHPITVPPDMPIAEALKLMREQKVRRFPVIDRKTKALIGIVTEKELLYASPSPATSLSMHEINYLMSKITVERVMTSEVITISEDTPIEQAALEMVDHRIGGLPVMRGATLVGIITETDLFKTFLELFAAREGGVRLTLLVPEQRGELAAITQAISSTAPAAAIKWPIMLLIELIGTWPACSLNTRWIARDSILSFSSVLVPWAEM